MSVHKEVRKGSRSLQARVIGNCEPSDMVLGIVVGPLEEQEAESSLQAPNSSAFSFLNRVSL